MPGASVEEGCDVEVSSMLGTASQANAHVLNVLLVWIWKWKVYIKISVRNILRLQGLTFCGFWDQKPCDIGLLGYFEP